MTHNEPWLTKILHLILLVILLLTHPSLVAVEPEDVETYKVRAESVTNLQDMSYSEDKGEQVLHQRKVLHEVYSGTNPIGNSIPKEMRRVTKQHRFS